MPSPGIGSYAKMTKDIEVRRWYENLRRGSGITADNYLRQLGLLCRNWKTDPQGIIKLHKKGLLQGKLEDEVTRLEKEEYAGSYISNILKPVKSWLDFNGLKLARKIRVSAYNINPTVVDERVPTKDELARILRHLDPRGKATASLIAFAGLRIESIGNYDGTDGLMLKDLSGMKIENNQVGFGKIPTLVKVRATLSKMKLPYFTFLSSEGCTYITEYLETRLQSGEKLDPESPLISHNEKRSNTVRKFLWATKVGAVLRGSRRPGKRGPTGIRGAGFNWRPYVLRAYFATALDIAESKGLVSHPWRQFFMGHKGDIEARYSTNKGRLPPDMIEEMRGAYKRCESLLQTMGPEPADEEKIKRTFKEQLLLVAGFKKEEVEKMNLNEITDEELQQTLRQKLLGMMANNGSKQKVIPITEVENHLAQGWEFVASLPNDKAILRVPF